MAPAGKIYFRLVQDADGYPPVSVESVWARPLDIPNEYEIDNVPFFAREATLGDVVAAHEEDGVLWFDRVVKPGTWDGRKSSPAPVLTD